MGSCGELNMNNINTIIICKDDYSTNEEFENAIKKAVTCLLDNNYIMTVQYEEKGLGIIRIDYNHIDRALGEDYPIWLSPEEEESIMIEQEVDK